MRALASTTILAVLAMIPAFVWAQAGWYVTPSASLTEEFDDNLFAQSTGAEADFITRFSPELTGGFRSAPLTVEGSYSLAGEAFVYHPERNEIVSRKQAAVDVQYLPTQRLTLGLNTSYLETQTPTELTTDTGIELGRREASSFALSPSLSYQFTRLTSGGADYSFTRSEVSGGVTNDTQQARLTLASELTPVDSGTLAYRLTLVDSGGSDLTTSHSVTVGWSRRINALTVLSWEGGSRVTDGDVNAEIQASLAREFKRAQVSVAYARSGTVVIGQPGVADTESISGSVAFEPIRSLQVSLAPSLLRSSSETLDTTVYQASTTVSYRLNEWTTATATYRFSLQKDGLDDIQHNIVSIRLNFAYPARVR